MKKIVCLILCLTFSLFMLCACNSTYENSIISHNYERDYAQTIVRIDPITESDKRDDGTDYSYTSDEIEIYKSQLITYINNYGSQFVSSGYMTYNEMIDYLIEQLVMTQLVTIEADIRFERHDIFWTEEDIDKVQRSVYETIDGYLSDIYDEILDKSGRDKLSLSDTEEEPESTETTYPVKTEEETPTERVFDEATCTYGSGKYHDDWYMNSEWFTEDENDDSWLPGNYGNADTKSLAREGVKRLVTLFEEMSENLTHLTTDEQKQIDDEIADLYKTISEQGVAKAYAKLGKTLLIKKLIGDSVIMSTKMELLQEFIESNVTVTEEDILDKYNKMLTEQIGSFRAESNYDTAATGTDLVLYRANGNYVYVKHILLPFSDDQKAYLESYKKNNTPEAYEAERAREVNNIIAYPHVEGEDDLSCPLTVSQIWSEVKAKMSRASASAYDAERTFDDLIFKYNTDPGIFNNETGYAVKYKLGSGESETYMQEFADASRAFRDEGYKVGQIYKDLVITDYGAHIMYYAADYKGGETLSLNSYTTPGRYTYVKDEIREELLSSKTSAAYTVWQDERVYYYRNIDKKVNLIEKAYKDLYTEE